MDNLNNEPKSPIRVLWLKDDLNPLDGDHNYMYEYGKVNIEILHLFAEVIFGNKSLINLKTIPPSEYRLNKNNQDNSTQLWTILSVVEFSFSQFLHLSIKSRKIFNYCFSVNMKYRIRNIEPDIIICDNTFSIVRNLCEKAYFHQIGPCAFFKSESGIIMDIKHFDWIPMRKKYYFEIMNLFRTELKL